MNTIEKIKKLVEVAAVYVPYNCEGISVSSCDHESNTFYGVGEDSGKDYSINYESVSLEDDKFYKLVLMEITE